METTNETQLYYNSLTKRQLFKAYRDNVTTLNDLVTSFNNGSNLHFGEPILPQIWSMQQEVSATVNALNGTVVPNAPEEVRMLGLLERRKALQQKEQQREANRLQELADSFKVGDIVDTGITKVLIVGRYCDTLETMFVLSYENGNKNDSFTQTAKSEISAMDLAIRLTAFKKENKS